MEIVKSNARCQWRTHPSLSRLLTPLVRACVWATNLSWDKCFCWCSVWLGSDPLHCIFRSLCWASFPQWAHLKWLCVKFFSLFEMERASLTESISSLFFLWLTTSDEECPVLLLYFTIYYDDEIHHLCGEITRRRIIECAEWSGLFNKECISEGKRNNSARDVGVLTGPPLWSRLKYLNNSWMNCHQVLYKHSCWKHMMFPSSSAVLRKSARLWS